MIPQILAALGEAALGSGARVAGKEMFWNAAGNKGAGSIDSRATPPPLPGQGGSGFGGSLAGQIAKGNLASAAFQKVIGQAADTLHKVTHPFETLEHSLKQFPGHILKVKESITSTAKIWLDAMSSPIDTVKELGDAVSKFVRLSNPALVKMFEYRVENTFATIGRTLEPILQALTRSAEKVGDAFAKLRPALDPIGEALSGIIDDLSDQLVPAARELAPWIKMAADQMGLLALNVKMVLGPMMALQDILGTIPKLLYPGGFDEAAKSGVAAREPRRISSAEEFQREQAKNALQASYGGDKPKTTESLLDQIYEFLKQNLSKAAIRQVVVDAINALKQSIPGSETVDDASSWLGRRFDDVQDIGNKAIDIGNKSLEGYGN